jgi:quercetin dioxygenase-like cupin family protein
MITRRLFSGCALCAALGSLGGTARAQAPGIRREILRQTDLAGTNHHTIQLMLELDPGVAVAPHTHPGIEASYVVSGETELTVQGEAPRMVKAGESFMVPAGVVHSAKNGATLSRIFVTYIVEKGKPLATPA